jgi:hypothetical protein
MHRSADLAEDARFLREHGGYRRAGIREVALRLGVSRERLGRRPAVRWHDPFGK